MKKNKLFLILLIILGCIGTLVSCSSDEEDIVSQGLVKTVSFGSSSKGLDTFISDINLCSTNTDNFWWSYTAKKDDSWSKTGQTGADGSTITPFPGVTKGLGVLNDMSSGKWIFTLYAYKDAGRTQLIYKGSVSATLVADSENALTVYVSRLQTAGKKGTLVIDPAKLRVAADSKAAVAMNTSGTEYIDPNADTYFNISRLETEFTYTVYDCNDDWTPKATGGVLISDRTTTSTVLDSGTHNIKIVFAKKNAGGGDRDTNSAEQYIACVIVNIYDYCTTNIQDSVTDGNPGIEVRRLKEFKINYYEGKNVSAGYTSDSKIRIGDLAGGSPSVHSLIEYEYSRTGLANHFDSHQYGRTEVLDVPIRDGFGFDHWNTKFDGTGVAYSAIPAFLYEDIDLYAQWGALAYVSITWDNNFPLNYKGTYRGSSVGYDKTSSGYACVGCSGGAAPTVASPLGKDNVNKGAGTSVPTTDPKCPGYVFKGWYYDDATFENPITGTLPIPDRANITRTFYAKWEPVKYKINLNLDGNKSTLATAPTSAKYWDGTTANKTYNVETGSPIVIKDATCSNIGFLGWSLTNTADAYKYLVDNDKVENLTNAIVDGGTVTLYAVWSDWFKPLEYIRSYGATQYIDTGCAPDLVNGETIKLTMEWSGVNKHPGAGEIFFGANSCWIGSGDRGTNYQWKGHLNTGWDNLGRYYFEDQKYDFVLTRTIGASNSTLTMKETDSSELPNKLDECAGAGTISGKYYVFSPYTASTTAGSKPGEWLSADVRIYSLNFYDGNGKIVHRFVPCRLLKTMNASTGLSTYCQDSTITEHKGNASVGANSEYGLWDCIGNKFYYNKGTGSFIGPDDEIKITLKSNYTGGAADRVQKVKKSAGEKLHKNVFSKENAMFLGWMEGTDSASWIDDETNLSTSLASNKTYYAKWSGVISRQYFDQVEYVASTSEFSAVGGAYIQSGVTLEAGRDVTIDCIISGTVNCATIFGSELIGKDTAGKLRNVYLVLRNETTGGNHVGGNFSFQDPTGAVVGANGVNLGIGHNVRFKANFGMTATKLPYVRTYDANGSLVFNGEYTNPSGYTPSTEFMLYSDRNMFIFADNLYKSNGTDNLHLQEAQRFCSGKIYTLTVKDTSVTPNVVKVQFVPAKLKSALAGSSGKVSTGRNCAAGEYGLWDLVSDKFYPNSGNVSTNPLSGDTANWYVMFDANSGIGMMDPQKIAVSGLTSGVALNVCKFAKPGYEFIGWNTKADGSGTWYSDKRILYTGDIKDAYLYAQWRPVEKPVSYTPLEYIQNEGTGENKLAYIDTKLSSTAKYRVTYNVELVENVNSDSFGVGNSYTGQVKDKLYIGGAGYTITVATETNYAIDIQNFTKLSYSMTPTGVAATKNVAYSGTHTTGKNYYLFGLNSNGVLKQSNGGRTRIYSAKIYDGNDKLVGDFVPVMLDTDMSSSYDSQGKAQKKGTLGMWDKVSKKFFGNANSTGGFGVFSNKDVQTIVFNKNGASGTQIMDDMNFKLEGNRVALTAVAYTNGTKKFIGWNTEADGTGVWYCDKYETDQWKGGSLFLYAQWEAVAGTVSTEYFKPVNYVRSGTAYSYVLTDIKPTADLYTDISFVARNTGTGKHLLYAADNSSGTYHRYGLIFDGTAFRLDFINNGIYSFANGMTYNVYHRAVIYRGVTLDGKSLKSGLTGSANINQPLTLFTGNYNGGYATYTGGHTDADVYSLTMWSNSTKANKVLAFVPCQLLKGIGAYNAANYAADLKTHKVGEIGFWDLVTNKFYANGGAGEFTCEFSE